MTTEPMVAEDSPHATTPTRLLTRAGVALGIRIPAAGLPEIVHWGAALREPATVDAVARAARRGVGPSGLDASWHVTVLPTEADGWGGRPALSGHRDRRPLLPRWTVTGWDEIADGLAMTAEAEGLALRTTYQLDAHGVLRIRHTLTNTGAAPLEVSNLESLLPVGDAVREFQDFSGRWVRERSPQRGELHEGSRTRQTQRGRTGHDAPFLTVLGTRGFTADQGEVWAAHLAWSGDAVYRTDALPDTGPFVGAGPLLRPGEIVLAEGESFAAPQTVFVWSNEGLDGLSTRLHASLRARDAHPHRPRPVTLNTWEAVYFAHSIDSLAELARTGASVGVERFVLDDGWFHGRRSDSAGLGDWHVDRSVWPEGLHPLADIVRGLGMEFGLWVEPEMINLDSELARTHPEWMLQEPQRGVLSWRNQYVLDLTRDEVQEYLLESLSALVGEYGLTYLKWDQNRDVMEGVSGGHAALHAHTNGVYRLMAALKARHPGLEIETCASGGGRVDLGVIEHTDRLWASDTNDPVERLDIQRWTQLVFPPELIGSHIGPPRAHTTGRTTDLSFRIAASLFDSLGIEWDITTCSPAELDELADGIRAYRRLRGFVHSARLRHLDLGDDGLRVTAAIAPAADRAVVRVARVASAGRSLAPRLRVPGLQPDALFRVRPTAELLFPQTSDIILPEWLEAGECVLSGDALAAAGLRLPALRPEQAIVLEIDPA